MNIVSLMIFILHFIDKISTACIILCCFLCCVMSFVFISYCQPRHLPNIKNITSFCFSHVNGVKVNGSPLRPSLSLSQSLFLSFPLCVFFFSLLVAGSELFLLGNNLTVAVLGIVIPIGTCASPLPSSPLLCSPLLPRRDCSSHHCLLCYL